MVKVFRCVRKVIKNVEPKVKEEVRFRKNTTTKMLLENPGLPN